jgi:hypothetical protein
MVVPARRDRPSDVRRTGIVGRDRWIRGGIVIFAHQGGWDEMLMVLVPVALVVFLLRLANKRVKEQKAAELAPRSKPPKGSDVPGRK